MAKFHNNSNRYLWKRGMAPMLAWLVVLIGGYFLFYLYHGPVTGINNDYLTILWGAMTLYLVVYWLRMGGKLADSVYSWLIGYIGEYWIRLKLKKLSDDFHVFYDLKIPAKKWNIDFIVVCKYGVFTVEVKTYMKRVKDVFRREKNIKQAFKQGRALYSYLKREGCGINWVYPVLVYARQKGYQKVYNKIDGNPLVVVGRETVESLFAVSLPKNEVRLSDEQIKNIVLLLEK